MNLMNLRTNLKKRPSLTFFLIVILISFFILSSNIFLPVQAFKPDEDWIGYVQGNSTHRSQSNRAIAAFDKKYFNSTNNNAPVDTLVIPQQVDAFDDIHEGLAFL